jgi:hypothetical protein
MSLEEPSADGDGAQLDFENSRGIKVLLCSQNGGGLERIKFLLEYFPIQTIEWSLGHWRKIEIALGCFGSYLSQIFGSYLACRSV